MIQKNNKRLPSDNDLPKWAKWLAQDEDGAWWAYSVEPLEFSRGWYENEVGLRLKVAQYTNNPDWKNSLTKIEK